ncbi:MAG TPA: dTDP-4-dehydrorhamnose reductase [Ignavibacteria bacterium]
MKILITGANGLLGQAVTILFRRETDHEIIVTSVEPLPNFQKENNYQQLDITMRDDLKKFMHEYMPDVIINCAAYTDVDKCETERELCWKLNVDAVKNLIIASRRNNAKVIHYSTDYVFDGKNGPYTEESIPSPVSFYGRSKLASENALLSSEIDYAILRTVVLFGLGINVKPNFALWLFNKLKMGNPVNIVDDQISNNTMVDDLAYGTLKVIEKKRKGIFNIAGKDIISRFEFAMIFCDVFKFDRNLVTRIKTKDLNQPAPRPLKSGLVTLKAEADLGFKPMDTFEALSLLKVQLGM